MNELLQAITAYRKDVAKRTIKLYFGTNECIDFESYEDIVAGQTIKELSDEDVEILLRIIPNFYVGAVFLPEDILDGMRYKENYPEDFE